MRSIMDDMFDDVADYEDDDDYEVIYSRAIPADSSVINTRTIANGATTLHELADMLRLYADHIEYMADNGYELFEDIVDGQGYAYKVPEDEVVSPWGN